MSSPAIEAFYFDEINESKFDSHALSTEQIMQVLENVHVVVRNRKKQRGLYLILGRDKAGTGIAIPMEPTSDPKVWRPITAWPCKESENAVLERKEKQNAQKNQRRS